MNKNIIYDCLKYGSVSILCPTEPSFYRPCALWRHGDTKTSRFCPELCARIVFCINLDVIAFELCDLWRYSLTTFMQNTMRAHSAGQISMEGGVDVNKGHMVCRPVLSFLVAWALTGRRIYTRTNMHSSTTIWHSDQSATHTNTCYNYCKLLAAHSSIKKVQLRSIL